MAMLRHRRRTMPELPMRLVYSVRGADDVIYADELGDDRSPHLHAPSRPTAGAGHTGRIDAALIADAAVGAMTAFVCGSNGFVETASGLLLDAGLEPADPHGALRPDRLTSIAPKRLALLAAIMGSFVAGLDATVVNVALPAIQRDLGGGLAGQQWVSNAYLLALGSLILVGGSLGDVFGERRVFSIGVAGFGVASLLCALAPTIEVLVAARALQGVFGALLAPSALAVIVAAFPPDERGAAIGSWTAWSGIATVIGPFAGGWLIDAASWRWIFAINVPFVLVTLALVAIAFPPPQAGRARRSIDWTGAALCALGLAGPVYALIRQPAAGWASAQVLGPLLAGLAVLRGVPLARAPQRRPDAPARPVPPAQLRGRQPADVRDVRRAVDHVLLPGAVPAAGRGLRRAPGRHGDAADDARDVHAVQALRRARRPLSARARSWAAGRCSPRPGWRGSSACRPRSTTPSTCCQACSCSRSGSR